MRILSGHSATCLSHTKHGFLPSKCTQVLRLIPPTYVLCHRNLQAKYNLKPNWNNKYITTSSLQSGKLATLHFKKIGLGTQHKKNSTGSNEDLRGFYRNIFLALISGWIAYLTCSRDGKRFFKFVTTAACDTTPDNCDKTNAVDSFKSRCNEQQQSQHKKCGTHKHKVSLSEAVDKARELCIRRKVCFMYSLSITFLKFQNSCKQYFTTRRDL